MRVEDLSIGDWVRHTFYEENLQIKRINGESERLLVEKGLMSVSCHLDHFEPIPLTAEILEKNGWVREDYYYGVMDGEPCFDAYRCTIYKNGYKYDIELIDDCGESFDLEITHIETDEAGEEKTYTQLLKCLAIQHTHQLQHALRLAGVEKEIEI